MTRATRPAAPFHPSARTLRLGGTSLLALLLSACATVPPGGGADPTMSEAAVQTPAPAAPAATDVEQTVTLTPPLGRPAPPAALPPGPVATDPLSRGGDTPVDLHSATAQVDLWARIRVGFAAPNLEDEYVRKWEDYYASRPDYVQRMTQRGSLYLFHIVEEVTRRGMPTELALLPFIESAFNPQAHSVAAASGMWQFIPGTGRDFKLKQNIFRDDRRDVLASTRAALDYLTKLHGMFGDWHLALAAYNWGEGSVKRAIARNEAAGLPTDYSSLRMPAETRNYVPKLQAVKNIVADPQRYNLALPELRNHPYFLQVAIDRDIDVDRAARLAGLSLDEFKQLNPQMNRPVILAAGTPQVLLPYDNANTFVHALESHRGGPLASWTAWQSPRTLKVADAARLVGMDPETLRSVNRIPPKMMVKAGSTLLVPRVGQRDRDVSAHVADNASMALAHEPPPFIRITEHAPRRGTTVAAVAKRHGLSPSQVAQWNPGARRGRFKAGQTIVLTVPNPAARAYARATADLIPGRRAEVAQQEARVQARGAEPVQAERESRDTEAGNRGADNRKPTAKDRREAREAKAGASRKAARASDDDEDDAKPVKGRKAVAANDKSGKAGAKEDTKAAKAATRTADARKRPVKGRQAADEDDEDERPAAKGRKTASKTDGKPGAKATAATAKSDARDAKQRKGGNSAGDDDDDRRTRRVARGQRDERG